jgi:hypothetical protein
MLQFPYSMWDNKVTRKSFDKGKNALFNILPLLIQYFGLVLLILSFFSQGNFPKLYQALDCEDAGLWANFARSSHCEEEFPAAVDKRCTPFQQVLLCQAARPDRLQSCMSLFACRSLGEFIARCSLYSETCEIRTPSGRAKSVLNSEVSSFHSAICTENSFLGPDEVSLFHRMSSFRRAVFTGFTVQPHTCQLVLVPPCINLSQKP